jgi:hypothetical protein
MGSLALPLAMYHPAHVARYALRSVTRLERGTAE